MLIDWSKFNGTLRSRNGFKRFLSKLHSEGYSICGVYSNTSSKVELRCGNGHIYAQRPNDFNAGKRCPHCPKGRSEAFSRRFNEQLSVRGYSLVGKYGKAKEKTLLRCPKGSTYSVKPSDFVRGNECPCCARYGGYNQAESGTLYMMRSECGSLTKFGITNSLKDRVKSVNRNTPFKVVLVDFIEFDDGKLPPIHEKELHLIGKSANLVQLNGSVSREWVVTCCNIDKAFLVIKNEQ